jgi:fructose-specific phosphotransferase system IIA component
MDRGADLWRVTVKIGDYLRADQIILGLSASTKQGVITELARTLRSNPMVCDFDMFLKDTFRRERFSTTGTGHEIAIPHARTDGVTDIVLAIGRSQHGIDFASLDGRLVRIVVLIGTPKRSNLSTYLGVLARLTRLLEKPAFRQTLLKAGDASEIIEAFDQTNP